MIFPVTAQMVVKNEENFVWFAVMAVLPFVHKFLVTDNGSTDRTWEMLNKIKSHKLVLKRSSQSVIALRRKQLQETQTKWFLLVDGDEIWPKKQILKLLQIIKKCPEKKIAVVNKTKNCVGDAWHYLPEETGKYEFFGKKGNFNIRLMRSSPYRIKGSYPWEEYRLKGQSINQQEEKLAYSSAWYLHCLHLKRSSTRERTTGRRKFVIEKGISIKKSELPEVFFQKYPQGISDPLLKRNNYYEIKVSLISPMKRLKRMIF